MMRLLAQLDPGPAVTRVILGAACAGRRSLYCWLPCWPAQHSAGVRSVRHALWLGVLVWVLLSPTCGRRCGPFRACASGFYRCRCPAQA